MIRDTVGRDPILQVKGLILLAALLAFLVSVALWFGGEREQGLFVATWVPSVLALGALLLAGVHEADR